MEQKLATDIKANNGQDYTSLLQYLENKRTEGFATCRIGKLNTWGDRIEISTLISAIKHDRILSNKLFVRRGVSTGTVKYDLAYGPEYWFSLDMIPAVCCTTYKISSKNGAWLNPYYDADSIYQYPFNEKRGDSLGKYDENWGWLHK